AGVGLGVAVAVDVTGARAQRSLAAPTPETSPPKRRPSPSASSQAMPVICRAGRAPLLVTFWASQLVLEGSYAQVSLASPPRLRPGPTRKWVCWTSHAPAAAPPPDGCVRASSECQPPAGP